MFIQTEATPNPATLKFIPGKTFSPTAPPISGQERCRGFAAGDAALCDRGR